MCEVNNASVSQLLSFNLPESWTIAVVQKLIYMYYFCRFGCALTNFLLYPSPVHSCKTEHVLWFQGKPVVQ